MLAVAVWARQGPRLALGLAFAAAVASHWFFDLLVHRHDLGLWGNAHKVGLALWKYPWLSFGLEIVLLSAAVLLVAFSKAWPRSRRKALGLLWLGLVVLQSATQFGAAPASLQSMVVSALMVFLIVPLLGKSTERAS